MQKRQKVMFWAVILSEVSHLFCCVLPTIISVVALLAGVGMISVMPAPLTALHDFLHGWELPMIAVSGLVLALGWLVDWHSRKVDCHDTGCHHEPCGPVKKKAHIILKIATVLFLANIMVYAVLHQGMGYGVSTRSDVSAEPELHQDHHHGHDH